MYGQAPKTPEWAEMITGVSAADIKALALALSGGKKTYMFTGFGNSRTYEGEQSAWAVFMLGFVTGNYGENGRTFGMTQFLESVWPYYGQSMGHPGVDAASADESNRIH
jgi:anaerobic selenocysteine-containing dehydrogenase